MPGGPSGHAVSAKARRVLLDALEALQSHRDAITLVGAQAIYLHTGEGNLAVQPFTADADLALDPSVLAAAPPLEQIMQGAGFAQTDQPGIWTNQREGIPVDLLVPASVGGPGKRGARLPGHSNHAARKVEGLEAVLVDRSLMTISGEEGDQRQFEIAVAGPGALLVAKLYKIEDRRRDSPQRQRPKDALDVYRLLQAISTSTLANRLMVLLHDSRSQTVTRQALTYLADLFGMDTAPGSRLATQDLGALDDPDVVAASCAALTQDLLAAINPGNSAKP